MAYWRDLINLLKAETKTINSNLKDEVYLRALNSAHKLLIEKVKTQTWDSWYFTTKFNIPFISGENTFDSLPFTSIDSIYFTWKDWVIRKADPVDLQELPVYEEDSFLSALNKGKFSLVWDKLKIFPIPTYSWVIKAYWGEIPEDITDLSTIDKIFFWRLPLWHRVIITHASIYVYWEIWQREDDKAIAKETARQDWLEMSYILSQRIQEPIPIEEDESLLIQ